METSNRILNNDNDNNFLLLMILMVTLLFVTIMPPLFGKGSDDKIQKNKALASVMYKLSSKNLGFVNRNDEETKENLSITQTLFRGKHKYCYVGKLMGATHKLYGIHNDDFIPKDIFSDKNELNMFDLNEPQKFVFIKKDLK